MREIIRIDENGEPYIIYVDGVCPEGFSVEFKPEADGAILGEHSIKFKPEDIIKVVRALFREADSELLEHEYLLLQLEYDFLLKKIKEKFCQME